MSGSHKPTDEIKEAALAAIREGIAQFWLDHPDQDFRRMIDMAESTLRIVSPAKEEPMSDEWNRDIRVAPMDGTRIRLLVETEVEWQAHNPLVQGGWKRVSDADKVVGWKEHP